MNKTIKNVLIFESDLEDYFAKSLKTCTLATQFNVTQDAVDLPLTLETTTTGTRLKVGYANLDASLNYTKTFSIMGTNFLTSSTVNFNLKIIASEIKEDTTMTPVFVPIYNVVDVTTDTTADDTSTTTTSDTSGEAEVLTTTTTSDTTDEEAGVEPTTTTSDEDKDDPLSTTSTFKPLSTSTTVRKVGDKEGDDEDKADVLPINKKRVVKVCDPFLDDDCEVEEEKKKDSDRTRKPPKREGEEEEEDEDEDEGKASSDKDKPKRPDIPKDDDDKQRSEDERDDEE